MLLSWLQGIGPIASMAGDPITFGRNDLHSPEVVERSTGKAPSYRISAIHRRPEKMALPLCPSRLPTIRALQAKDRPPKT
jgi:hypothetical protein